MLLGDILNPFQEESNNMDNFLSYLGGPNGGATSREVLINVASEFERYLLGNVINRVGMHVNLAKTRFLWKLIDTKSPSRIQRFLGSA